MALLLPFFDKHSFSIWSNHLPYHYNIFFNIRRVLTKGKQKYVKKNLAYRQTLYRGQ